MIHWFWIVVSTVFGFCIGWTTVAFLVSGKMSDMWYAIRCAVYYNNLNPSRELLELPTEDDIAKIIKEQEAITK